MKANLIVISRSPKNTKDHFEDQMFVESNLGANIKSAGVFEYDISRDGNFNGEYNNWFMSIDSWPNYLAIPDMDYLDYLPEPVYDPETNYKNGGYVTLKDLFHMYQKIKGSDQNIPYALGFDITNGRVIETLNGTINCIMVGSKIQILFDMLKKIPSIGWAI